MCDRSSVCTFFSVLSVSPFLPFNIRANGQEPIDTLYTRWKIEMSLDSHLLNKKKQNRDKIHIVVVYTDIYSVCNYLKPMMTLLTTKMMMPMLLHGLCVFLCLR